MIIWCVDGGVTQFNEKEKLSFSYNNGELNNRKPKKKKSKPLA